MSVTLLGMSMEASLVQNLKALPSMLVTLDGMSIEVRLERPWNASYPNFVTELGITVFLQPNLSVLDDVSIIALQLFRESYTVFPDATVMEDRLEQ